MRTANPLFLFQDIADRWGRVGVAGVVRLGVRLLFCWVSHLKLGILSEHLRTEGER